MDLIAHRNEPPPPSAKRVAERAIILSVVSCRGIVDDDKSDPRGASDLASRSYEWLEECGLKPSLSPWETKILSTPFGKLDVRDRISASWLSEAVVVLSWALGKTEIPGFEEQCDPSLAANSLGFLQAKASTALAQPVLRETTILGDYNEFVYNLHWRIRDYSINKQSYDFESLAKKAWGEPVRKYGLSFADKDLCIGGVPISRSEERAWRSVASITQERHRASNWLVGYESEDFYQVTTDT